jgi:aerobic carbon-monoxide dehydrogenase large subunit
VSAGGARPWVGTSVPRKEDLRLVTGEGQYVSDLVLPFMLEAQFLRSPYAHARIRRIDVSAAKAMPGVVAIRTGADLAHLGPILTDLSTPKLPGETKRPSFTPIPVDEVGYAGDLVAVVVAKNRYLAEDALRRIEVDYEPLPAVLDPEAAAAPGAPLVYPEWGDNVVYHQAPVTRSARSATPTSCSPNVSPAGGAARRRWSRARRSPPGTRPTGSRCG